MRPAALGRRIPAVNVAVAVAAIIFAHVMTVLLVWLLYEVPRNWHWNHLADTCANVRGRAYLYR